MDPTADIALMAELHEKISDRIRLEVYSCIAGYPAHASLTPDLTHHKVREALVAAVAADIVRYPGFVAELTKAITQKLSQAHIY